ncbi:bacterial alpha-L-rhamnosidase-domain-containing protein [Xylogone sp. PMI_703]|nr:bacterial alpha-L-rhamnosidase-domain-containing protein [Xylogone sp. PMI_703]
MASVIDVRFEHYRHQNTLGVQESKPRLSWRFQDAPNDFQQEGYEIELSEKAPNSQLTLLSITKFTSPLSTLVQWPYPNPLRSRQKISVRVRVWDEKGHFTPWSEPAGLETGLLSRADWHCERIAAPWGLNNAGPGPEQLYRKDFLLIAEVSQARLYITAQGVYEAELNGQRVGGHFLAPGWTTYDGRIQYQTYDVTSMLLERGNCLGVRVAEGWFSGRIGFEGGHRNIWGPCTALISQLEITYTTGHTDIIASDGSWIVAKGPIQLAEIYDGEKYDATKEITNWSSPSTEVINTEFDWEPVLLLSPLPYSTELTAGFSEPVKRIEVVRPIQKVLTPSGKIVIDFGQILVGYVRLKNIKGTRGHKITVSHAEVLENGELGTRPLRICKAEDEYTLSGNIHGEQYEPRFTFHGFRYAQVDGWSSEADLEASIEAVVCYTDMKSAGSFSCSDPLLNKLYQNICWGMRGNFLSVPTDCPQRDERLGWSGDLALFVPTATLLYDCFGMLKNWLIDVEYDQNVLGGVPAMVTPNATLPDPVRCRRVPCAIWHDVTVLAPWELYQETGDESILAQQYNSMITWMRILPRSGTGHLWDPSIFQLGDWLDPAAPPNAPWKGATDSKMVANAFLIHSLDLMAQIAAILGKHADQANFDNESQAARKEFQDEYVSPNGRVVSDSQTAYALAICFDLLTPDQMHRAGIRLVELVRKNEFKIGTGFAGTPFLCEALALTGHIQVAYSMLLEQKCPSWLYPVTMGATTVWERWDSMLPDGSINPGEMTSFNHYAFGSIAKFLHERIAGLQRLDPGWKSCRIAPSIGAEFTRASASHITRYGLVSCSWETIVIGDRMNTIKLKVSVPHDIRCEVVLPSGSNVERKTVGPGDWFFEATFNRKYNWPVEPLKAKS